MTDIEVLNDLGLSIRGYNVLKREGVHTIEELWMGLNDRGKAYLYDMRNMGERAAISVTEALRRFQEINGLEDQVEKVKADDVFEALKERFARAWESGYAQGVADAADPEQVTVPVNPWRAL
jgi:hypothetical protein